MSTVCLAVMAKNEAHIIARALASARPLVDTWIVMDTGSSDATRDVAREAMAGMPGEVVDRPWRDTPKSRTESFEIARERADYVLVLDADDIFEYAPGSRFPELTEPGYALTLHDGSLTYPRTLLVGSKWPWKFVGAVHEYAQCDGVAAPAILEGIVYRRIGGGARDFDPQKFVKDAGILESELRADPSNARYVFYLARSYEDAREFPRALANYERRALMGGWDEEIYFSKFAIGRVREKLRLPPAAVIAAYLEASSLRPTRAEPLCEAAKVARTAGDWASARELARRAMALPVPKQDTLFIDREVYDWRAIEEFAGASAHLGDYDAAVAANQRLLDENRVTPDERVRIARNIAHCIEAAARARGD